jgi:hypothetical protein
VKTLANQTFDGRPLSHAVQQMAVGNGFNVLDWVLEREKC